MVYQIDVKIAFLYGNIEEEVYVCQPLGFEDLDFPNRVYKVEKALYGLHQALGAWYETLSTYLLDNGFQKGKINKTLFIKRHKGDILLVQVYVDDIIFGSTKKELCFAFKKLMHEKFQMSSMGELTFFLGLQVKQKKDGIFISQDKYVAKILKKFRFTEVKTASTHMETQKPLLKDEDGEEVDVHIYQVNLKVSHLYAVKRIFRYLKGQLNLGLWYPKDSPFNLVAHADSDYVGASLDRKSTTCGSAMPTDPHHTPTILQPSSSQPQKTQKPKKPKRKDTQVPQPSGPTKSVTNEAVHKELGDRLVRATIIASSLGAEQDNGNITKTQSKATPNESSSQGKYSGGGPRCQETMGDTSAQTRFESVSKHSNDSLLARGNTLQSDKDSMKLNELMALCTTLQNSVLDLDKTTITQRNEIDSLKRRVKKLKKRNRSRTHNLERLYKVGLIAKIESSSDEESLGEDASKQRRRIDAIDEVFVVGQNEDVVEEVVDAAQVSTAATTVTINTEEITLAQVPKALKTSKPKVKGIVFQEPGKSTKTTTTTTIYSQQSQDKGKGIMIEEPVKPKKKDQIRLDEEAAKKLQAEFDEEERLAREKAKKEERVNIALIKEWDDIQAKINVDHQLAKRLQA
nr:uncharacterized mitochondrial protein AtMg00810-like [Tanacetum cinerariifolium]